VVVTIGATVVTTGVEFAILPSAPRAKTWVAAVIRDGKTGLIIDDLVVGFYEISARVTSGTDTIVVDCGTIEVT